MEYIAVTALFFSTTASPLTPFAPSTPGWHLQLSPELSQSPLGVRTSFPETDKVQTSLILKLQFLIQFKAPLFPQLRLRNLQLWGISSLSDLLSHLPDRFPPPQGCNRKEGKKPKWSSECAGAAKICMANVQTHGHFSAFFQDLPHLWVP